MIPIKGGNIAIATGMLGSEFGVHIIDRSGNVRSQMITRPAARQPMVSRTLAGGLLVEDGDDLLFSQASSHLLAKLDPQTGAVDTRQLRRNVFPQTSDDFIQVDSAGKVRSRWFFPRPGGLLRLPNGRLLQLVRLVEQGESVWELYDSSYKLVHTGRIKGVYDLWAVRPDGSIVGSVFVSETKSVPVLLMLEPVR